MATRVRSDAGEPARVGGPSRIGPQHVPDPANRVDHPRHTSRSSLRRKSDEDVGHIASTSKS